MNNLDISTLKPVILIGETQVIDSGCLLITENDSPVFKIKIPNGTFLIFRFRFIKDENKKDENGAIKQNFEYHVRTENGENLLDITLANMDDVNLAGNIGRSTLAIVEGHPVSFKFRLSSVGQNPINYIFNYTWFLEPQNTSAITSNDIV